MDFTNVTKALTARGFKVSSFETAKEAAEYLNSQIDGATVGFGGSITLEELGLYALLSGHNTVFSHWHLPEGGDAACARSARRRRAASIICSPPTASPRRARSSTSTARATVWLRRSTATKRSGSSRAKISSRPPTTRRSGAPATSPRRRTRRADHCYDCKSPGRICRALTVLWGAMMGSDMEVVLVNEDLGY